MAILVFQHHEIGRPGRLGATLRDHGLRLDIRELHARGAVPADLDGVDGVVSLGGPQNVDDPPEKAPWMRAEMDLLAEAHARGLPVVGVCLGAQMLASALGGAVEPMDEPEIGFHTVSLTAAGQTDTLHAGIPWDSPQFLHHTRHVASLPAGGVALASSKKRPVQAFRVGMRSYGFQHHFEADQRLIREMVASAKDDLHRAGYTEEEIEQQIESRYAEFARLADRLCVNIAAYLMPTSRLAHAG